MTEHVATQDMIDDPRAGQRLALAIPAALGAAALGAVGWAAFTVLTQSELGLVAIAVGALVGLAVRKAGRGVDPVFGLVGGAGALLGCLAGMWLAVAALAANEAGAPLVGFVLHADPGAIAALAVANGNAIDLLLLAIAVWKGWKLSFDRRP